MKTMVASASSTWNLPAASRGLIGREWECQQLSHLLALVRGGESQTLVLRGEPGIGKTALLDFVRQQSKASLVLESAGTESEMELAYAGLHQLCIPLLPYLDLIPAPQRDALDTVFGAAAGTTPDPFLVGLAVLSLLAESAQLQPVVCIVDDAQWLDQASRHTIAFVARRLRAEAVGVLFAEREPASDPDLRTLPQLTINGLTDKHAATLVSSVLPGPLDERVRDRVVAETRGNPLAVMQFARGLTAEQAAGGFGLSGVSALTTQIEESFRRRLLPLPASTRRLLLVAAAEPGQDAVLIWRAAAQLGVTMRDAEPAIADGYIQLAGLVRFCHPLARSTVYKAASADERRATHRALADATDPTTDPERRAWHRAQATPGLDEDVAAELQRSAGLAQARGGQAAAAAFHERAAELTPDPRRRAERALTAARSKYLSGSPERALRLLSIAQAGPSSERHRALGALLHAQILSRLEPGHGSPLLAVAERLDSLDPELASETYRDAFYAAQIAGKLAREDGTLRAVATARLAAVREPSDNVYDVLLDGVALTALCGYEAGVAPVKRAISDLARANLASDTEYKWLPFATLVALSIWDEVRAYELSTQLLRQARSRGALSTLPTALMLQLGYELFAGDPTAADALVDEFDVIQEVTTIPKPPYGLLLLAALRGDERQLTEVIERETTRAAERGEGQWLNATGWAEALLNNGLGRYDRALVAAQSAMEPPREIVLVNWATVELVEAAARSGEAQRAADALRQLTAMSDACGTPWIQAVTARSRALLAPPNEAEDDYLASIDLLERTELRTELARSRLVYGEWLRREGRRVDARVQLRAAHDLFSDIGAEAFASRARRELAASGETVRRRTPDNAIELTQQERQIARLAANGLTNPQIATQLFISARTVEWHLGKVFSKLGITSRRELEDALRHGGRNTRA